MLECAFRTCICLLLAIGSGRGVIAQGAELPFSLRLQEITWGGAPRLQSFAVAQDCSGRWLFICGRTSGLHGRGNDGGGTSLPANFEGLNDRLWVIDPSRHQATSRSISDLGLTADVAASLTVTGPEFVQVDDRLYIVGGYGFSADHSSMKTYRQLTVVDVAATVNAILTGTPIGNHLRQTVPDDWLRLTGGELEYLDGTFVLVFGQAFNYAYSPSSSGNYSFQVRPFRVTDDGSTVTISKGTPKGSAAANPEFRRRDLNVVRATRPDGLPCITAFGGVFTPDAHAWSTMIDIYLQGGQVATVTDASGFQQRLCQYRCAVLPIYQASNRLSFTVFFGGISEFTFESNAFKRDGALPFVNHVGCIKRSPSGATEWLVCQPASSGSATPLRLPDLLGTSAQYLPVNSGNADVVHKYGVLDLDKLRSDQLRRLHLRRDLRDTRA